MKIFASLSFGITQWLYNSTNIKSLFLKLSKEN